MPYTKQEKREAVQKNIFSTEDPGDLNYLITRFIIQIFVKAPRYVTIHILRRDFVVDPKHNKFLQDLRNKFADRFTTADIYAAAAEAYQEFRDRVGRAYEDKKIQENGDLPEYEEVLKLLKEPPKEADANVTVLSDTPAIEVEK